MKTPPENIVRVMACCVIFNRRGHPLVSAGTLGSMNDRWFDATDGYAYVLFDGHGRNTRVRHCDLMEAAPELEHKTREERLLSIDIPGDEHTLRRVGDGVYWMYRFAPDSAAAVLGLPVAQVHALFRVWETPRFKRQDETPDAGLEFFRLVERLRRGERIEP